MTALLPYPTLTSDDPASLMSAINQIARIRLQDIASFNAAQQISTTTVPGNTSLAAADLSDGTTGTGTIVLGTTVGTGDVVLASELPNASSAAVAWVYFTTSGGTATIVKQYNVASVTRTAQGLYTVAFTTALSDANYVVVSTALSQSGVFTALVPSDVTANTSTDAYFKGFVPTTSATTTYDIQQGYIVFFG